MNIKNINKLLISKKKELVKNKKATMVVLIAAVFIVLYLFRGLFISATINNKPIFRWSLVGTLEKQYGQQTLDSLVTKELITQATSQVEISQEELQKQIEDIRTNFTQYGSTLETALAGQGMTMVDLEEQISLQLKLKETLKDRVVVTDEEIAEYVEQTEGEPEAAQNALFEQKLNEEIQKWIAEIKPQSTVNYFGPYSSGQQVIQ